MRRVIAVVAAIVLAGLGTFLLVRYVQGAEDRALEGINTVEVLIVDLEIPAGTLFDDVPERLVLEEIPQKSAAEGAVSDRTDLTDLVAAIDLVPGEQVIADRLMTEADYQALTTDAPKVAVPTDLLEVTFSLAPQRVVGGELDPGDLVAVFASFEPFAITSIEPTYLEDDEIIVVVPTTVPGGETTETTIPTGARTPNSTKIILHNVLVTNVQVAELPPEPEDTEEGTQTEQPDVAPTGKLLITLALDPVAAERVVFTAEFGTIWLALEGEDVDTSDTEIQTRGTVYRVE